MTKNFKIFFIIFALTFLSGWGINVFEKNLKAKNPQLLAAEVIYPNPIRKQAISEFVSDAESIVSVFVNKYGEEITLFEKNASKALPIASLTKLMTAKIILENYDPNQLVQISEKAASLPGNGAQRLKTGQTFRVIDLLYPALMESNNTAASALAEIMGKDQFVNLMNLESKNLGMANTRFLNFTGLDQEGQYSSAQDLVKLTKNLLEKKSFVWHILSLSEIDLYSAKGEFIYAVNNTNELLGKIPSIVGGKTGETPQAGGCLLLVTEAPKGRGYLINIILNSRDRFSEMEKLLEWNQNAHIW